MKENNETIINPNKSIAAIGKCGMGEVFFRAILETKSIGNCSRQVTLHVCFADVK
jgi:hypothetical protein